MERALSIVEATPEADWFLLAETLHERGKCVREAGRPAEAEKFVRRALKITEAETGPNDMQVMKLFRFDFSASLFPKVEGPARVTSL